MTERTYTMSKKELDRVMVIRQVVEKRLKQGRAARQLGITARQVRRLVKRYREEGEVGLISSRRGQPSNNRLKGSTKQRIIKLVYEHYSDFGPTLACEKLIERHELTVSRETLRQWMATEGLWVPKNPKQIPVFQMRERRARQGELVQIDGSPHDWFEGRSERCTLLVFIDDATGGLCHLRFVPAETTQAYMNALKCYLYCYGRPVSFYSDCHGVFRVNTKEPQSGNGLTQFGRALERLDIEAIHARTPQAKGRVERANKTLQDRLVKELRLRGINTPEQGNAFLNDYMALHNQRFAVLPRNAEDAHRPLLHSDDELALILSRQSQRTLSKNLICQYKNTQYQVTGTGQGYALRNTKVTVCELCSGEIVILRKGKEMPYTTYRKGERPAPLEDEKSLNLRVDDVQKRQSERHAWKPAPDHPWRKQKIGSATTELAAAAE